MSKESERNKRYYWLKLNDDFFEDDTMQYLEEQENGKEHALIYLKLLVRSVRTDGKLFRLVGENLMPYDEKFLAKITNSTVDTVKVAMDRFVKLGLVDMLETGEIYMKQIDEMVGSETGHAKQKRLLRARETMSLDCPNDVSEMSHRERVRVRDKELDKEKDILSSSDEQDRIPYKEIVDYLNLKTGKKYQSSGAKTKSCIKARWNEGFRVNDFKKVVDNKCFDWIGNADMSKFLRPETVFGPKFEGYLNENNIPNQQSDFSSIDDEWVRG